MAERGVVHAVEVVLLGSGLHLPGKLFLATGRRAVCVNGKAPLVIAQLLHHGRVVDVHRLAVFHMEATGNAVVGVKETGIDAIQDLLPRRTATRTYVGQSFAQFEAVVIVPVPVGIGNHITGQRADNLHMGVFQVHFQHMHGPRNIGETVLGIYRTGDQFPGLHHCPVIIGIQRPVHRVVQARIHGVVVIQVEVVQGLYHGIHQHGRMLSVTHKPVTGIADEVLGGLVVGAPPARSQFPVGRIRAQNGAAVDAAVHDSHIVPHKAAFAASGLHADVAVIGTTLGSGVATQQAACVGTACKAAHKHVVSDGETAVQGKGHVIGNTFQGDTYGTAYNAANGDIAGRCALERHLTSIVTNRKAADGGAVYTAKQTRIGVLVQIHRPGNVLDGVPGAVHIVFQRRRSRADGNPFLDG